MLLQILDQADLAVSLKDGSPSFVCKVIVQVCAFLTCLLVKQQFFRVSICTFGMSIWGEFQDLFYAAYGRGS